MLLGAGLFGSALMLTVELSMTSGETSTAESVAAVASASDRVAMKGAKALFSSTTVAGDEANGATNVQNVFTWPTMLLGGSASYDVDDANFEGIVSNQPDAFDTPKLEANTVDVLLPF
jgi:hypothetical protein